MFMKFNFTNNNINEINDEAIILGVFKDDISSKQDLIENVDLSSILNLGDFTGKKKQLMLLYNVKGMESKRLLLVGLGKKEKFKSSIARSVSAIAAKNLRSKGLSSFSILQMGEFSRETAEGVILGLYTFDELKEKSTDNNVIKNVTFIGDGDFNTGIVISEAQVIARRLTELPANIATPTYVSEEIQKIFKSMDNTDIEIHEEKWALDRKMNSFLSVAAGSDQPAKFAEIKYYGTDKSEKPIILAGKGITFDTGGISLKGGAGMGLMRGDMGGAAAVIGILYAVSKLKLNINVIGLTPLTENMPSGKATKPSDVVFASNGKSIEIDNTDAEGRLILADALVYADEFTPHTVIDIATLTGAMGVALGQHYTGSFVRSDELWQELEHAGIQSDEKLWRMPLDKKYKKQLKSTLADLKNVGGRPAGSVTAAMFLSEFTETKRWAHLDIAGTAWVTSAGDITIKGMTGVPVRALTQFIINSC
ncbi:leucyl aminopeptidase [archaeon]|nr:leucyl aminopeptidase [archaeon]NDB78521.1 leucyl aminopeptidase [archaeon]